MKTAPPEAVARWEADKGTTAGIDLFLADWKLDPTWGHIVQKDVQAPPCKCKSSLQGSRLCLRCKADQQETRLWLVGFAQRATEYFCEHTLRAHGVACRQGAYCDHVYGNGAKAKDLEDQGRD